MRIRLYEDTPNYRELNIIIDALRSGQVIIYPTNTGYAYACDALQSRAIEKIYQLKGINPKKQALSLMFADISQLSDYCFLDNKAFKFIKSHQGEYTFILPPASTLPKILKHRQEVGGRLVQNAVGRLILSELGNPLITSSLPLGEGEELEYRTDPELVEERYGWEVSIIVDGGIVFGGVSTIVDCTKEPYQLIRQGLGQINEQVLS